MRSTKSLLFSILIFLLGRADGQENEAIPGKLIIETYTLINLDFEWYIESEDRPGPKIQMDENLFLPSDEVTQPTIRFNTNAGYSSLDYNGGCLRDQIISWFVPDTGKLCNFRNYDEVDKSIMLVEIHKNTSHQKSCTWVDYDIFVHVTPPGFSMHWNMEWKRFMVDRGMNRFYDMLMKFFPELNIGINFTNKPGYSLPWKDEGRYISEVMQFLLMIFQKQLPCQPYHIA